MRQCVISELRSRRLIQSITNEALSSHLHSAKCEPRSAYLGIDPTADSLHLGHLIPLMALIRLRHAGHTAVSLVGTATATIGDPTGRQSSRAVLSAQTVASNASKIQAQLTKIFHSCAALRPDRNSLGKVIHLSNADWLGQTSLLSFLATTGNHARVTSMLARNSVRERLQVKEGSNDSAQGLSFTELTYQLLQAHDFSHLYDTFGVTVQIGGSDQWGNITAGTELIHKFRQHRIETKPKISDAVYGLTTPLLTTSNGEKFGKSAGNAVWLDENKTSAYDFYQYFFRQPDAIMPDLFYKLTFMSDEEIAEHLARPTASRRAQLALAQYMTRLLHGDDSLRRAQTISDVLYPKTASAPSLIQTDPSQVRHAFAGHSALHSISKEEVIGQKVANLFARHTEKYTINATRRLIDSGAFYLNGQKLTDSHRLLEVGDLKPIKDDSGALLMMTASKGADYLVFEVR